MLFISAVLSFPYQRNAEKCEWLKNHIYYKHIGLYAYRVEVLKEITSLPQSSLELAEALEQAALAGKRLYH